jgi:diaminohydroxyphosphoribosylaminopyrimidine deaminase/5-amino-6-(5-phosphoribosylamino)uracil reductase
MPEFSEQDTLFMRRALALAARGRGDVEPNPLVGAVITRGNKIVGEGYHRVYGGPHAEVHALSSAGKKAKGATLYVSLEPCCHFGKTPPCTNAVIAAGISRVVVAMVDPFEQVAGKGIKALRKAGIKVEVGLLEEQARTLNAPFIKRVTTGLPYVIAKWAQTLDGRIATATGQSKWISSEASRAQTQNLRGRVDAIVVGIGTAIADDPLLIARPIAGGDDIGGGAYVGGGRLATRIVFDSECRLPADCQLVRTVATAPVLVFCAENLSRPAKTRAKKLAAVGVAVVPIPVVSRQPSVAGKKSASGRKKNLTTDNRPLVTLSIPHAMRKLGKLDYTNVLVEGGPELLASFFAAKQIDLMHIYIAPKLLAGLHSKPALAGPDILKLADAYDISIQSIERTGPDLHIVAKMR